MSTRVEEVVFLHWDHVFSSSDAPQNSWGKGDPPMSKITNSTSSTPWLLGRDWSDGHQMCPRVEGIAQSVHGWVSQTKLNVAWLKWSYENELFSRCARWGHVWRRESEVFCFHSLYILHSIRRYVHSQRDEDRPCMVFIGPHKAYVGEIHPEENNSSKNTNEVKDAMDKWTNMLQFILTIYLERKNANGNITNILWTN